VGPERRLELVLEDGARFEGSAFGARRAVAGEVVFSTAMTGYVEALTDPSYRGQILVSTYPLVGNYGVPPPRGRGSLDEPFESARVQVQALVVHKAVTEHSHPTARRSLGEWLDAEGVPGLQGVDTRALTMHLRSRGTMRGVLRPLGEPLGAPEELDMRRVAWAVAPHETTRHDAGPRTVLVVDAGAKDNLIRSLLARGLSVVRAPFTADVVRLAGEADGVVLGSGPGDPKDVASLVEATRALLARESLPILGVCLGSQVLALAAGADTAKLPYGHRGVNQPVQDLLTRRCYVTSQNHGYAVVDGTLPRDWEPWFVNTNDGTNEGLRAVNRPHLGVQFHPEAHPGPDDAAFLFDDFARLVGATRRP
jgi:carbamoyl-phosphate synthase small subunit